MLAQLVHTNQLSTKWARKVDQDMAVHGHLARAGVSMPSRATSKACSPQYSSSSDLLARVTPGGKYWTKM